MTALPTATTKLRTLLAAGPLPVGGSFDALSARLAEQAGFPVVHLSGFGVEVTQIGAPDLGLTTLTELAFHAARICDAVTTPIIADIDTGFGGVLNIERTIHEMERAGLAGVHLEDQTQPKRCPLLAGRQVLDRNAATDRVAAACDARRDSDFVIVARTDADVQSIDEVIERSNLYLSAGADVAMPMSLNVDGVPYESMNPERQMSLLARIADGVDGPLMTGGGPPPKGYTTADVMALGYALVLYASSALSAAASAMAQMYTTILRDGTDANYIESHHGDYYDGAHLMRVVHLDHYRDFEDQHTSAAPSHTEGPQA